MALIQYTVAPLHIIIFFLHLAIYCKNINFFSHNSAITQKNELKVFYGINFECVQIQWR